MYNQIDIIVHGKKFIVDFISTQELINRKEIVNKYAQNINPDSSNEDIFRSEWCLNAINNGWNILRVEYLLNKYEHGYGKGDVLAINNLNQLCAIEFKSLKDNYGKKTDIQKIEKLKKQAILYASIAQEMYKIDCIPLAILQLQNNNIEIINCNNMDIKLNKTNDSLEQSNTTLEIFEDVHTFTRKFTGGFKTKNRKSFKDVVKNYCVRNKIDLQKVKMIAIHNNINYELNF